MEVALFFLMIGIIYFVPTILGWHKRNIVAIFALNLFLGWSIIGWVVALVWALTNDYTPAAPIKPTKDLSDDEAYYRWRYEQEKKNNL
ncbi:hypothetical protein AAE02nite_39680 [Adhaeribacter aerolatus]|uniref:Superinfection immunity protein n=1 Tax=Adhaeribacter aerolatus TaxID=670289 RepID=A0A512B2Y1_9BACT|nr:superinfection immunity protein [Adhaeribacter aerolatus]GEO06304.1 hypothetical protein AAE02nite_39680 [Adhaeribacter aerolatus]